MKRGLMVSILASGALALGGFAVRAADAPAPAKAPETCKAELSSPTWGSTIKANPNPYCFPLPLIGDIYVGGALSAYGYTGTNPLPYSSGPASSDRRDRFDFSNLLVWAQKADGPVQFFVMAGGYAIPTLGATNLSSIEQMDRLFGPVPIAWGKVALNDNWSVQAGRLPTLIGTEPAFTFQNQNIQRGLLFAQENVFSHGVQLNYSNGPWSLSVAGTDGFYSGKLSWFTGSLSYKIDDSNTVGVNGGFNAGRTSMFSQTARYMFATPLNQQNSGIVSVNYTYSSGPLTITPYAQFTNVDRDVKIGILGSASTAGAAILASYAFTDNISLAGRVEYTEQSGRRGSLAPNLLGFGPGSSAFSFTVTPTYTYERFFVRGEYSVVALSGIARANALTGLAVGTGFGRTGNKSDQQRFLIETGVTF